MKGKILILLGISLVTGGCTPKTMAEKEETTIAIQTEESNETTPMIDRQYDFTYLEKLSDDKLKIYNNFLFNGSIDQLSGFTPEEIVLVYMNLVLERNIEKLYILTYNGGKLPSADEFIREYPKNFTSDLEVDYLMFRYFDNISINTASNEDVTIVQLEIVFGNSKYIKAYPLKLEDGIWKVAIYQELDA